jgi:radical SAM/Cys-rich protein
MSVALNNPAGADPIGPASAPLRPFASALAEAGLYPLTATGLRVLQLNLGKLCNQTCKHCHVDAGPTRTERMTRPTMEQALRVVRAGAIPVVDLTGGAPEMNPDFRWLVAEARGLGCRVIDRCNLTILTVGQYRDLPEFLAGQGVEIVASLPHFLGRSTDAQRGAGVFDASIRALNRLNALGYGQPGSGLTLDLVYNPTGAFLAPRQESIEPEYRRELLRRHGVVFNRLYVLTNIPINRFLDFLVRTGQHAAYMERLAAAFNPAAAAGVMCREMLSVGWDGRLHDCDFNQMLDLGLAPGQPAHLDDLDPARLVGRPIRTGAHCYGCTAGQGSSCGGAIVT